jgi:hypothetical protein
VVTVAYVDSDGIERTYTLGAEPVIIGRAPECEIRSNDPLVSRNHARMYVDQLGNLFIQDLGSANGVFVGPSRVKLSEVPLGAVVVVGSLRFRRLADTVGTSSPTAPTNPAPLRQVGVARPTHHVLVVPEALAAPAVAAPKEPGTDVHRMLVHLLDAERKMRRIVEEERDAYGARLAELHAQLATTNASLAAAEARVEELRRMISELTQNRS